jgi:hypothetical protein
MGPVPGSQADGDTLLAALAEHNVPEDQVRRFASKTFLKMFLRMILS